MDLFKGKTAIITGAASGIGRALVQELARRGTSVVIADILEAEAHDLAKALVVDGGRARGAACDVADADAVARIVECTVAEHGRLDFMFNNAGIAILAEIKDTTLDAWYKTFDVNIRGVVHGICAALPVMIEQGHGRIINTASITGLTPAPGLAAYVASKHAIVGLTNTLRAEASNYGVRAHLVCPGMIATQMHAHMVATPAMRALREFLMSQPGMRAEAYPVERCADDILEGIARDEPIILVGPDAESQWRRYRDSPQSVIDRCTEDHKNALQWLDAYRRQTSVASE
jgi:NAD(P)-dependent dehydrogenase (short-subunit alcohol dehydrogenase family)